MPSDLLVAYETFVLLATKYEYVFFGAMMKQDPPTFIAVGNVTEKGHDLATLFRETATLIDEKTEKNQVTFSQPPPETIN